MRFGLLLPPSEVKELGKLVKRTRHVLEELGMAAFRDALKKCALAPVGDWSNQTPAVWVLNLSCCQHVTVQNKQVEQTSLGL